MYTGPTVGGVFPAAFALTQWFRSRQSDRLNIVSYIAISILGAAPIYLCLVLGFQLWSAIEENDWITERHPQALTSVAGLGTPFLDVRDALLTALQDQTSDAGDALRSAASLKAGGKQV